MRENPKVFGFFGAGLYRLKSASGAEVVLALHHIKEDGDGGLS